MSMSAAIWRTRGEAQGGLEVKAPGNRKAKGGWVDRKSGLSFRIQINTQFVNTLKNKFPFSLQAHLNTSLSKILVEM